MSSKIEVRDVVAEEPFVVGISTHALFDCEAEAPVLPPHGPETCATLRRANESAPLRPGAGFPLIKRLLGLNSPDSARLVEVVLISRGTPDFAIRSYQSCASHGLAIVAGSFTSGRPAAPYAAAWDVDLFLSSETEDVCAASALGIAAATLGPRAALDAARTNQVHFGLDGDGVMFGSDSDAVFREHGLEAFERHEVRHARNPMAPGPFGARFLKKLVRLRDRCAAIDGASGVRISLITARNAPAHERAIRTLRRWGVRIDEAHFVGHRRKSAFLALAAVDVFFDDNAGNITDAARFVTSGLVPRPADRISSTPAAEATLGFPLLAEPNYDEPEHRLRPHREPG